MIAVHRELRPFVKAAIDQGWSVEKTGGGHLRFKSPTGAVVFTPSTPGGGNRAIENTRAALRRAGLNLPR